MGSNHLLTSLMEDLRQDKNKVSPQNISFERILLSRNLYINPNND